MTQYWLILKKTCYFWHFLGLPVMTIFIPLWFSIHIMMIWTYFFPWISLKKSKEALGKPSKKKTGNSLVFYQRGGTPPPPLARFGQFPVFSREIFYCFKMLLRVWNTFCMIWVMIFCDLWRKYSKWSSRV